MTAGSNDCPEENSTQHYLGPGHGHGPVASEEVVLFAVFERTDRDGNRLKATTFKTKELVRSNLSLARLTHTTRADFEKYVAEPLRPILGPVIGIARAEVADLRGLLFT